MRTLNVSVPAAPAQSYPVVIGEHAFAEIPSSLPLDDFSRIIVITEPAVAEHWLEPLRAVLPEGSVSITVPKGGEQAKNFQSFEFLLKQLYEARCDRKSLVLNLGGGMIGDLGGFAASAFMRGVDFVQCPTTLLSQVDASIGGKTGINFSGIKNLVGAFRQPQGVFVDLRVLSTLPEKELWSGYAEVLKHGCIADRSYFEESVRWCEQYRSGSFAGLDTIIERSCEIKCGIVEADEQEAGRRKLLNFGHTFGHAVESLSHRGPTPLLHGEAVALGMAAESFLSTKVGSLSLKELEMIEHGLRSAHLPVRTDAALPPSGIQELILRDKKNVGGKVRWTLLSSLGEGVVDCELPDSLIDEACRYLTGRGS